jgi:hypothetical protein
MFPTTQAYRPKHKLPAGQGTNLLDPMTVQPIFNNRHRRLPQS